MDNNAIIVSGLTKLYKLYDNPQDRLKETLHPFRKQYHRLFHALHDVNFEVRKGETVGIIGQNGSGKSTLLKILTGILTPSAGVVNVQGKIAALLELGAGFNPEMTGVENIYLNGTIMGYTREDMDKKLDSILDFADIGDFVYQPVKIYSSGMFARLAFAVAINVEPDILIVDEALSVGDIFFQNKCYKKFDEIREKNTTILFVTHDLGTIRQLCSRVLWLNEGRQIMFGEKQEVCSAYFANYFKKLNQHNENNVDNGKTSRELGEIKKKGRERKLFCPQIPSATNSLKSDDVEIISFFIKDKNGITVEHVETLEEYTMHIVAKFYKDIDNIIFGFTIENHKGISMVAINTYMKRQETYNVKQGQVIEAVFSVKLPKIMRGEYLVTPAVAKGDQDNHIMLTSLYNVSKIEVENNGYNFALLEIDTEPNLFEYDVQDVVLI